MRKGIGGELKSHDSKILFIALFIHINIDLRYLQIKWRNDYHISELQDYSNTQILNNTIPENTPFDSLQLYLNNIDFYSNDSTLSPKGSDLHIIDVFPETPPVKSGRQYCGYGLVFDLNKNFKYAICNYPCH